LDTAPLCHTHIGRVDRAPACEGSSTARVTPRASGARRCAPTSPIAARSATSATATVGAFDARVCSPDQQQMCVFQGPDYGAP